LVHFHFINQFPRSDDFFFTGLSNKFPSNTFPSQMGFHTLTDFFSARDFTNGFGVNLHTMSGQSPPQEVSVLHIETRIGSTCIL
jgi:hypothetical protein